MMHGVLVSRVERLWYKWSGTPYSDADEFLTRAITWKRDAFGNIVITGMVY